MGSEQKGVGFRVRLFLSVLRRLDSRIGGKLWPAPNDGSGAVGFGSDYGLGSGDVLQQLGGDALPLQLLAIAPRAS